MDPLLVTRAPDGSSLILGEEPADPRRPFRLVFLHESRGAPEPVLGHLYPLWVTIDDRQHLLFAGTTLDEPGVERVLLEFPNQTQTCRVRSFPHHPGVWMSFPEPFEPGSVVIAWWLGGDKVFHKERTGPLEWERSAPDPPQLPPPDWPPSPSPEEDPSGWTFYAPDG